MEVYLPTAGTASEILALFLKTEDFVTFVSWRDSANTVILIPQLPGSTFDMGIALPNHDKQKSGKLSKKSLQNISDEGVGLKLVISE